MAHRKVRQTDEFLSAYPNLKTIAGSIKDEAGRMSYANKIKPIWLYGSAEMQSWDSSCPDTYTRTSCKYPQLLSCTMVQHNVSTEFNFKIINFRFKLPDANKNEAEHF